MRYYHWSEDYIIKQHRDADDNTFLMKCQLQKHYDSGEGYKQPCRPFMCTWLLKYIWYTYRMCFGSLLHCAPESPYILLSLLYIAIAWILVAHDKCLRSLSHTRTTFVCYSSIHWRMKKDINSFLWKKHDNGCSPIFIGFCQHPFFFFFFNGWKPYFSSVKNRSDERCM